jgi:hypothetical protein
VIFITAVTGNLAYYLALGSSASEEKSMDWVYDIDKVHFPLLPTPLLLFSLEHLA